MNRINFWNVLAQQRTFAPADGAGAGGGEGGEGQGGEGGEGQGGEGGEGQGGEGKSWWEDARFGDEQKTQLTALGLTVDDPLDAVAKLADMEAAAKKKLGKPADQLMDRPTPDGDLAEYLRNNGETFGVPDAADGYEINRPENVPEANWDSEFEGKARETAHKLGMSQQQIQGMTEIYAEQVSNLVGNAEQGMANATAAMMQELTKDWGQQTNAKMAQAQMAAQNVAEAAGLDTEALASMTNLLSEKIGDARVIRMFSAIAEGMADDTIPSIPGGGSMGATNAAEARAQIHAMEQPDSAYSKAILEKKRAGSSSEFERLHKEFVRLVKIANPD